jgi:hypothetical protein
MSPAGRMGAPCRACPRPSGLGTSWELMGSIQDGVAELNGLPDVGLPSRDAPADRYA